MNFDPLTNSRLFLAPSSEILGVTEIGGYVELKFNNVNQNTITFIENSLW